MLTCANCCFSRLTEDMGAATAAGNVSGSLVKSLRAWILVMFLPVKSGLSWSCLPPPSLLLAVSDAGSTAPDSDVLYSPSRRHTSWQHQLCMHTVLPGYLAVTWGDQGEEGLLSVPMWSVTSAAWQENQLVSVVVAVLTDGDTDLAKMWTETSYIFSLCLPMGLWDVEVTLGSKGAPGKYSQCLQAILVSGGASDFCRWLELPVCMGEISAKTYSSLLPLLSLLYFCSLAVFPLDIWLPSIPAQLPVCFTLISTVLCKIWCKAWLLLSDLPPEFRHLWCGICQLLEIAF